MREKTLIWMRCLMKSKWRRSQRASEHVCVSMCACVCVCLLECLSVRVSVCSEFLTRSSSADVDSNRLLSEEAVWFGHWILKSLSIHNQSYWQHTESHYTCTIVGGPSSAIVAASRLLSIGIEWRNYSFGRWRDNRRRMLLPQQPEPHSLVTDGLHHIHVCHP